MDIMGIVLLIVGAVICVVSFILPKKREELDEDSKRQAGEQIRSILDKEIAGVQTKIDEVISESIEETSNETERALEKMTNEKIMAINEYSDTVIEDINKNHKEVLFLYDMLNDKHVTIRNTVTEVEKTVGEVTQTAKDIEISAKETAKEVKNSEEAAKRAVDITNRAEKAAELTAQNMELDVRRIVEDMIRDRVEETLEKTATPMIQERVDEILNDASCYMEQQPKIVVGETAKEQTEEFPMKEEKEEAVTEEVVASADDTETKKESFTKSVRGIKSAMEALEAESEQVQAEEGFVQGITEGAPQIIIEGDDEDNLQYYVLEPEGYHARDKKSSIEETAETREETVTSEEEKDVRSSKEKILSLHKAGMSNVAIAKELGLGVGEVKLVIDLFEGM